ncbi:hypothetical protein PV327_011111 [Microctonus hyperodae]|uniref:Uncharacterized protein n=1 Tax=Microctonus hyperodae TaxID=165561 RepID=A0AA39FRW6_MICHY|nr:hypothetical protein PV327_011111 [Microctonus hyperodae]
MPTYHADTNYPGRRFVCASKTSLTWNRATAAIIKNGVVTDYMKPVVSENISLKDLKTRNFKLENRFCNCRYDDFSLKYSPSKMIEKIDHQKFYNEILETRLLVLDFDEKSREILLSVNEKLVEHLKPHQARGI